MKSLCVISPCIHNNYYCRLAAAEVMKQLESAYEVEEDPYSKVNLVDFIRKTDEKEASLATGSIPPENSSLKMQIEAIKV